ncbi:MAG: 2Fe-2S iron-sulfur cluster-binding protein [Dehalococcoidia bacterium]|nr:2Fe-2S iron-sulfur cluster-binding protein [Dehalococcoidia bacterium]
MADKIDVTLNGHAVQARPGTTILDLAAENGIVIPTLCFHKDLTPTGACRMCVVEVARSRTLVASCHTPATANMAIETHSPKVLRARKVVLELMMASHPDFCLVCDKANICELRALSAELGAGMPRIRAIKRFSPIEDNPYVIRDLTKCVLCYRCIKTCREIKKANLYSMGYRAFHMKVVVDNDRPLDKEICKDCGICVPHCPVGALTWRPERFHKPQGCRPLVIRG